MLPHTYTGKVR